MNLNGFALLVLLTTQFPAAHADAGDPSSATVSNTVTTMIGSAEAFGDLGSAAIYGPLVANGNVGLDGMGSAVLEQVLDDHNMPSIAAGWSGTGSGLQEETEDNGTVGTTVTLFNATSSVVEIPIEAATFATRSGKTFEAVGDVHVGNWSLSSSSSALGSYWVPSGQSVTIPVEAVRFGPLQNVSAGEITSSSISGLTVTTSATATDPDSWTNPSDNNQSGFFTDAYSEYPTIFTAQGFSPAEANVNINESHEWTANDLASWKGYVDSARSVGILNLAPIWTDNQYTADLTRPFATSPWFANVRAAALYSGGLAFDVPPNYWYGRTWDNYHQNVEQMIEWCRQNGLRSSVIINGAPPYGVHSSSSEPGYDPVFREQTASFISDLKSANALPTQIVVENYLTPAAGNYYDPDPADTESLNSVAAYISSLRALSPSPSETSLEVPGTSAAQTSLIITGIQASEILPHDGSTYLYRSTSVSGWFPTDLATIDLFDTTNTIYLFNTSEPAVASPGHHLTFSGTVIQITAFLQRVQGYSLTSTGSAKVVATLTDAAGQVTRGRTIVLLQ